MNTSAKWNVRHEPRGDRDSNIFNPLSGYSTDYKVGYSHLVKNDFKKDNYGEVNSCLRYFIDKLNVSKKGIIIRSPKDIFISTMNKGKEAYDVSFDLFWSYLNFLKYNRRDILYISFEKMVSNVSYLNLVCEYFGVNDVCLNENVLSNKVNETQEKKYKEYRDISRTKRKNFEYYNWDKLMLDMNKKIYKNNAINLSVNLLNYLTVEFNADSL
jgi:hypothetical protein